MIKKNHSLIIKQKKINFSLYYLIITPTISEIYGSPKTHNLKILEGARGVMFIVVGNGHDNTSSDP